jgi:hypothetical protein
MNLVLKLERVTANYCSHSAERKVLVRTDGAHTFSVSQ